MYTAIRLLMRLEQYNCGVKSIVAEKVNYSVNLQNTDYTVVNNQLLFTVRKATTAA